MIKKKGIFKHSLKRRIRKRCKRIFLLLLFIGLLLLMSDYYVGSHSKGQLYESYDKVPYRRAALVLGCGKYTQGRLNLYYQYRINAASELWHAGKIDAVLVSGDNSRRDYGEPTSMKEDLVAKGIPDEYITIDYAGFRTLDSIIRAEKVFGVTKYTIISQPFHCRRAIYLAQQKGHSVVGYCAKNVTGSIGLKVRLREVLARTMAVVDVIFSKDPKYLGKKEKVHYRTSKAEVLYSGAD